MSTTLTARLHSACVKCIACIASSGIWDIKKHGATEHAELPGHLCTIPEISPIAPNDCRVWRSLPSSTRLLKSFDHSGALCIGAGHHHDLSNATRLGSACRAVLLCYTTACSKGVHRSQIRHNQTPFLIPDILVLLDWGCGVTC